MAVDNAAALFPGNPMDVENIAAVPLVTEPVSAGPVGGHPLKLGGSGGLQMGELLAWANIVLEVWMVPRVMEVCRHLSESMCPSMVALPGSSLPESASVRSVW